MRTPLKGTELIFILKIFEPTFNFGTNLEHPPQLSWSYSSSEPLSHITWTLNKRTTQLSVLVDAPLKFSMCALINWKTKPPTGQQITCSDRSTWRHPSRQWRWRRSSVKGFAWEAPAQITKFPTFPHCKLTRGSKNLTQDHWKTLKLCLKGGQESKIKSGCTRTRPTHTDEPLKIRAGEWHNDTFIYLSALL